MMVEATVTNKGIRARSRAGASFPARSTVTRKVSKARLTEIRACRSLTIDGEPKPVKAPPRKATKPATGKA